MTDALADWIEAKGHAVERCKCGAGSSERIPGAEMGWRCVGCKRIQSMDGFGVLPARSETE